MTGLQTSRSSAGSLRYLLGWVRRVAELVRRQAPALTGGAWCPSERMSSSPSAGRCAGVRRLSGPRATVSRLAASASSSPERSVIPSNIGDSVRCLRPVVLLGCTEFNDQLDRTDVRTLGERSGRVKPLGQGTSEMFSLLADATDRVLRKGWPDADVVWVRPAPGLAFK